MDLSQLSPIARGRLAFCCLSFALYLSVFSRLLGDALPMLAILGVPPIAVILTGASKGQEAILRTVFVTAMAALAAFLTVTSRTFALEADIPPDQLPRLVFSLLSGLAALNLMLVVVTSAALRQIWPTSDSWTNF